MDRITSLKDKLSSFDRIPLAHLPTPLERLDTLSGKYGVNLYLKRDDQTGLAFGGNKTRKLEFIMAEAVGQGADSIITWAGIQSNWCRQTAAAAAKLGMKSYLILFSRPHNVGQCDGNLLLDYLFDATIETVDVEKDTKTMMLKDVEDHIEAAAEKERAAGRIPYIAPIGGSIPEGSMIEPWGAIGYVVAMVEIAEQASDLGISFDSIVHATGSGATQAGLLAGSMIMTPGTRVIGICVSDDEATMKGYVKIITDRTFQLLGYDREPTEEDLIVKDEYLMEGYGIFNEAVGRALILMAEEEGVLLDPVYTGKAMTGLLDMLEEGVFKEGENILLLHSGGTPAIFPYRDEIVESLKKAR